MDPNEALKRARLAATEVVRMLDGDDMDLDVHGLMQEANELVQHFQALDDWMSSGGFSPGEWSRRQDS